MFIYKWKCNRSFNRSFKARRTICKEEIQYQKADIGLYRTTIMETLSSSRHQKLHVDFSLTVDGKDFLVHKNVLAVSYKFFRDLFKVSPAVVHYELINVDGSALKDILNFLHTWKYRLSHISDILILQDLKEIWVAYLSSMSNSSSCGATFKKKFVICQEESILKEIMEFWHEEFLCDLRLITSSGRAISVHKSYWQLWVAISKGFLGLTWRKSRNMMFTLKS